MPVNILLNSYIMSCMSNLEAHKYLLGFAVELDGHSARSFVGGSKTGNIHIYKYIVLYMRLFSTQQL